MAMQSKTKVTAFAAVPVAEISQLYEAGYSLIPLGKGPDGKSPLVTFEGRKRLPLPIVIDMMQKAGSSMYGVRLKRIVVVDCDTENAQTLAFVAANFGQTDFAVKTSRGRHFYYFGKNTRPEKIAIENVNIELKTGPNAYVVGPGSVRPDNGTAYTLIGDCLPSPCMLPSFADRRDRQARQHSGLVPIGGRNNHLFKLAREHVEMHDSAESLFDEMKAIVEFEFDLSEPFPDSAIWKPVRWIWKARQENRLYGGEISEVRTDYRREHRALMEVKNGTDGEALLIELKHMHDRETPRRFPVCREAMAKADVLPGWSASRYWRALQALLITRILICVRKGGAKVGAKDRVASLYMFNRSLPFHQGERVSRVQTL